MDKVEMTVDDINALLAWRDQHKDEVRSLPTPLRAVEIVAPGTGITIKGVRDGDRLSLHVAKNEKRIGNLEFEILGSEAIRLIKNRDKMNEEDIKTVLTVYCSLMALMTYGMVRVDDEEDSKESSSHQARSGALRKNGKRNTYILRRIKNGVVVMPKGSHASPSGIFSVRGHFRHYKDGKVIWISEYKKGTGQKKRKTYKVGAIDECV